MKNLVTAVLILLALNFLVVAGGAGWLFKSDRSGFVDLPAKGELPVESTADWAVSLWVVSATRGLPAI